MCLLHIAVGGILKAVGLIDYHEPFRLRLEQTLSDKPKNIRIRVIRAFDLQGRSNATHRLLRVLNAVCLDPEDCNVRMHFLQRVSTLERDNEDEEDGDDDEVDNEGEEFATVKLGLRAMMRGMMSLAVFNIVLPEPNSDVEGNLEGSSPIKEEARPSDSLSPDPEKSQERSSPVGYRRSPITLQRATYSNSKFIRTFEKKIDRNIDVEAGAELLKSGKELSMDLATNTITAMRTVKLPWKPKNVHFKEESDLGEPPKTDGLDETPKGEDGALVLASDALVLSQSKMGSSETLDEGDQKPTKKKSNRKSVFGLKF